MKWVLVILALCGGCRHGDYRDLEYRVVDGETGAPVAGALARVFSPPAEKEMFVWLPIPFLMKTGHEEMRVYEAGTTDGDGRLVVNWHGEDRHRWITFMAKGYLPGEVWPRKLYYTSTWWGMENRELKQEVKLKRQASGDMTDWAAFYREVPEEWDGVVRFCVVDYMSGKPMSGVEMRVYDGERELKRKWADGRGRVDWNPKEVEGEGRKALNFVAKGYRVMTCWGTTEESYLSFKMNQESEAAWWEFDQIKMDLVIVPMEKVE